MSKEYRPAPKPVEPAKPEPTDDDTADDAEDLEVVTSDDVGEQTTTRNPTEPA